MCNRQLQLPQQVALTELKRQVSAKVKVIIVTKVKTFYFTKTELLPTSLCGVLLQLVGVL